MVVSKDSKRKRKESPPPQPPIIESSPEMPKRTKVQAQRKFAQGQNAPSSSSYTANLAASSSSTIGGPSASSESRDPPTEILPNKRPKTEDFLTFLCFRGTPALPAHLDFLNQGKGEEVKESANNKKKNKASSKTTPKKQATKKGRKAKAKKAKLKTADEPVASTSAAAAAAAAKSVIIENNTASLKSDKIETTPCDTNENSKTKKVITSTRKHCNNLEESKDADSPTNNKAAEQKKEQETRRNRIGNDKTKVEEKANKSQENKRRSNRTNAKHLLESENNEKDDENLSGTEDIDQKVDFKDEELSKKSKTPTQMSVQTSSTPTKEAESVTHSTASKGKKGKASAKKTANRETEIVTKETSKDSVKSEPQQLSKPLKQAAKRQRQKESPIFIPSPEPTGRMTRQRAFFEPVKVLPTDSSAVESADKNDAAALETSAENSATEMKAKSKKTIKDAGKGNDKDTEEPKNPVSESKAEEEKVNSLNVFDFSSDDEQPLSKTIKLKKGSAAAGSSSKQMSTAAKRKGKRKLPAKKLPEVSRIEKIEKKKEAEVAEEEIESQKKITIKNEASVGKNKRSAKINKRKQNATDSHSQNEANEEVRDEEVENEAITPPPTKKLASNPRQQQQKVNKAKADITASNGITASNEKSLSASPVRSQRPSRKTKEAAAIYMGIIGQKLQQDEDEDDDDMSLNSFPDLPNVKEMEKMEFELKKNKNAASSTPPTIIAKPATKTNTVAEVEKQVGGRRGRPPKQGRRPSPQQQPPAKREIEGMLVKKGALAKAISSHIQSDQNKVKQQPQPQPQHVVHAKDESDDEDFLLNEEVNETKRKLEKSFSDSDDEPLAVKVNLKSSDKDLENDDSRLSDPDQPCNVSANLISLSAGGKRTAASLSTAANAASTKNTSLTAAAGQNIAASQAANFPTKATDKKSPITNTKMSNATVSFNLPTTTTTQNSTNSFITKMEHKLISPNLSTSYLPPASPHYHGRPSPHAAIQAAKSPTQPPPTSSLMAHISAPPPPPQSPLKYQTPPPTTYPPPIDAYPSPKINPNFLTPKFDRSVLPRTNNFPSPSPIKFDLSSTTSKTGGHQNSTLSPKTSASTLQTPLPGGANAGQASSAAAAATAATANTSSSDPLKDEIGSILAANLMPSKEESGKIFGIASVSLAQSSGPDNTKCTLGKCGSIHKPVLGPVVPTEGYIGDQLSSKERRKAKVNMTHEQIQKWLIECSSNPDEIQDDMDDDYDDNLRPNLFATTPPPTRDDKESTSFSSSSKATRDLGKSESAWSGKGPSLKAIPVVASASTKEEQTKNDYAVMQQPQILTGCNEMPQLGNIMAKAAASKQNSNNIDSKSPTKEKVAEKKFDKKSRDEKNKETNKDKEGGKQTKADKEKDYAVASVNMKKTAAAGKQSSACLQQTTAAQDATTSVVASKPNRKKNNTSAASAAAATVPSVRDEKLTAQKSTNAANTSQAAQKRTPVYNQKAAQKTAVELKETTTTSHKKKSPFSYNFGAFSVENEKSIYSFDKDDDDDDEAANCNKPLTKPIFRRQSRRDSQPDDNEPSTAPTAAPPRSPLKKRTTTSAAVSTGKAHKDAANASQSSSVSLTLSPAENCKQVKVSLEAEQQTPVTSKVKPGKFKSKVLQSNANNGVQSTPAAGAEAAAPDSDSDGHTFYIPLQGTGTGGSAEGGIQGVAVKLGREGPEGPNQKVIMHATLVTKAQMGQNSKPLPDSMNASEIVKNLLISSSASSTAEAVKKSTTATAAGASTSAAAAAVNSASNSLKSVPIGTVQPRFKGAADTSAATATATATATAQPSTSTSGSGLVRVNSNSSLFSGSAKSRHGAAPQTAIAGSKKFKDDTTPIKMANNTAFPRHDDPTQMVEAPIFRPTEKEFSDPIDFIERITPIAARFGICKIVPPAVFKPECRISDEMRFTAYNQYVHKMLHRWGPSAKELSAIKKYLATQSIVMNHPPWIGGMEVDLPRLYHTVQELGGLKEVIEKKKWARVAEEMCIPKLAQDRVTKLDDIYCKYLLPYDTLSPTERQKLFDEVEADWAKREARARRNADRFVNTESVSNEEDDVSSDDDDESEEEVDGVSMECIVKGRSMPLSQFYRIARNTMTLWFKNTEPTVNEVEAEFWRHVAVRDSHVCVHAGSIDSSGWGYGFPTPGPKGKGSNYARHPWNLKVLTNNSGSVLRSLGPVMGVTVPTLHVGMLFSACCWYRDPHGLSWIEYLHTGASKLWYGIPDDQSANFRSALTSLIPTHCQNKTIWLPCDTVMVPPHMLTDRGVSLCRIEQKPGEFIVVFPRAYTSSLATGYVVSESVYFATNSWLDLAKHDFRDIHDSCEPAMFSLEQLLFALGSDQRVASDTLQQMLPMLSEVYEKETAAREQLKAAGVTSTEKVLNEKVSKSKKQHAVKSIESECDLCRANLYISMVRTDEGNVYCLQHALKNLNNGNIQAKQCKLIFAYNIEDVDNLIRNLNVKIQQKRIGGGSSNKKAK